jgi:hypothetical protein
VRENLAFKPAPNVGLPSFPEGLESTPTIRRAELHREDVGQLAVEVGAFGLGPLEHADRDITQRGQAFGDDPQGHRLQGSHSSSLARLDQIDPAEIPTRVTHHYLAEVTITGGDLDRRTATAIGRSNNLVLFLPRPQIPSKDGIDYTLTMGFVPMGYSAIS